MFFFATIYKKIVMRLITSDSTLEIVNTSSIVYDLESNSWEPIHIELKETPKNFLNYHSNFTIEYSEKTVYIIVKKAKLIDTLLMVEPLYCKLL